MAEIKFKMSRGAGRKICGLAGTVSLVDSKARSVCSTAQSMADYRGDVYTKGAFKDRKGMAAAYVSTGQKASKRILDNNFLLKALH